MQVRHPNAEAGEAVDYGDGYATVGDDGTFEVPDDAEPWLRRWCEANGWDVADVRVDAAGTCDVVMNNDEVCGRELPCPYHSED